MYGTPQRFVTTKLEHLVNGYGGRIGQKSMRWKGVLTMPGRPQKRRIRNYKTADVGKDYNYVC